jgi:hypothetical protein
MVYDVIEASRRLPKGWTLDKYFVSNGKRIFTSVNDFLALVREGRKEFLIAQAFIPDRYAGMKPARTVRLVANPKGFEVQRFNNDLRSPTSKMRVDSIITADAVEAFINACAS